MHNRRTFETDLFELLTEPLAQTIGAKRHRREPHSVCMKFRSHVIWAQNRNVGTGAPFAGWIEGTDRNPARSSCHVDHDFRMSASSYDDDTAIDGRFTPPL